MIRTARYFFASLTVLLLFAPALLSAQPEIDVHLSDLTRDWASVPSPAVPKRGEGVARTLDALLSGKSLPTPCLSPVVMDLWRNRQALPYPAHESLRLLSVRPNLPHDGLYQTRDGRFVIHYTVDAASSDSIDGADADLNGIPDRVDRVEMALARAVDTLAADMSWPLPVPGPRTDSYDVYLVSLGPGREGLTVLDREIASTPQDDASSHILVDGRMDPERMEAAVIHQFAHASLLALSTRAPSWWNEATAGWMEERVTLDPSFHQDALARRLERLDLSLTDDSLLLSLGDSLWVSFLADRREGDSGEIRGIWMEQSVRGGEPFTSLLDEILRRNGGDGLAGAFREYTRWALFTGPRDDGEHFRQGPLLPPLVPRATFQSFPADSGGEDSVEPLGAAVYRLVGDGSHGGVRIRFEAAEVPTEMKVDLVVTPSTGDRRPFLVELSPGPGGTAEAGIPWREVAEAMMIVRNPVTGGKPARYRFTASLDPLFPYDLSSFAALSSAGGVTLQWSTSHESDLLGWNITRSSSPGGPFQRINPVTLPSGGDSEEETDYIYQDTSATQGRRYFYRLEGITLQGLPERSFPISGIASAETSFP